VELVYDPPLGSNYSVRMEEGEDMDGDGGANAYLSRVLGLKLCRRSQPHKHDAKCHLISSPAML
jgi:hypothetical protein